MIHAVCFCIVYPILNVRCVQKAILALLLSSFLKLIVQLTHCNKLGKVLKLGQSTYD